MKITVHCDIVNSQFQYDSRAFCTFVPNKSYGHLQNISLTIRIYSHTFHSEFSFIEVWFAD